MNVAEELFNAYNDHGVCPWKTFDGRDVPRWDGLSDQVRAKWTAAAEKIRSFYIIEVTELVEELKEDVTGGLEKILRSVKES